MRIETELRQLKPDAELFQLKSGAELHQLSAGAELRQLEAGTELRQLEAETELRQLEAWAELFQLNTGTELLCRLKTGASTSKCITRKLRSPEIEATKLKKVDLSKRRDRDQASLAFLLRLRLPSLQTTEHRSKIANE